MLTLLEGTVLVTEFSFFPRSANLSVADIVALTGAEPGEGTDLARRVTNIAPIAPPSLIH